MTGVPIERQIEALEVVKKLAMWWGPEVEAILATLRWVQGRKGEAK